MSMSLGTSFLPRNVCLFSFPRAKPTTLEQTCRRYAQIRKAIKMQEALIECDESKSRFTCTLRYTNPDLKVNRTFNFNRQLNEPINTFLQRIEHSIRTAAAEKLGGRKKKSRVNLTTVINEDNVKDTKIALLKGDQELDKNLSCSAFIENAEPIRLSVFGEEYAVSFNPPTVTNIALPSCIMATFPTYPRKFETKNVEKELSTFTWYKQHIQPHAGKWIEVGTGYVYTPTNAEVGCKLKLACIPRDGERSGPLTEITSNSTVQASPGECPFEKRHEYTRNKLSGKRFRVVTYNILADMYSESSYSKSVLFPHCPEYALSMDYRKNLILKELIGYNADIICLQEVDKKVYMRDLDMILSPLNYESVYNTKPAVQEGLAIFFDKTRFTKLYDRHRVMSNPATLNKHKDSNFYKIWSEIKNEELKKSFMKRPTIVQVIALKSKENPSKVLLVGNTHLYFHPEADNIRLLQAYYAITYLQEKVIELKEENPELDVSILFCGDFNSSPEDGIFTLMTRNYLPPDSADWKSNQDDVVENITLEQSVHLGSACGTPKYTNYTPTFAGCLDYIFYQNDELEVEQSVPLPSEEELTMHTALPSPVFPSDHVSLCADLKWVK